jgi:predicted molibdopterin-dependent oxidoreductase YjgC
VRAARKGANVIIVDPRRIPLVDQATLFLQVKPGTDIYVFLAIMHVIIREGWADEAFIAERTEGYDEFQAIVADYTPERASLMAGVPVEQIEEAARLYAQGQRVHGDSSYGEERGHSTILYAMGITQRSNGTDLVMTLANLAMLCGQIGKPSTGVNPLRGQSNVQGACDLGCLVNVFPGYQRVTDAAARTRLAQAWRMDSLPGEVGLTIVEAMHDPDVRAVYVMGENPMMSDPNTSHVEEKLRSLDLLVAQDIFPSETAQLAHVILPAASSLEKDGTFTNTERRVQFIRPVLPAPGQAWPDWQITAAIAQRFDQAMGIERAPGYWEFATAEAIFEELVTVTPIYRGMSYGRLGGLGLQWPCPEADHPGTQYLHKGKFSRGLGKFNPIEANDPAEQPDAEYPLILTTGRVLYHYHTGTMTRRSGPLHWREPRGYVEINARDAAAIDVLDERAVVVKSRRGTVRTRAKISDRVPPGTIFLAFHWREAPANMLTQDFKLDPVAKIPEYKVCAVRLENPRAKRKKS